MPKRMIYLQAWLFCGSAVQMTAKGSLWDITRTAPVYVANVSHCQVCQKSFSIIKRKRHCHNW
jgi:hypothetical protein